MQALLDAVRRLKDQGVDPFAGLSGLFDEEFVSAATARAIRAVGRPVFFWFVGSLFLFPIAGSSATHRAVAQKPVGAKAQRKVVVPDDLDLDTPIFMESDLDEDESMMPSEFGADDDEDTWDFLKGKAPGQSDAAEAEVQEEKSSGTFIPGLFAAQSEVVGAI